jgi:hypothetical protein
MAPLEKLLEEIEELSRANRLRRDVDLDRRLLRLRHQAGIQLLDRAPSDPSFAAPSFGALPGRSSLVEVGPGDLTPELLRAAILRHGCLLVRGLVEADDALGLAEDIDRAFEARSALTSNRSAPEGFYEEFALEPPFGDLPDRPWIEEAGGVLAVDSPKVTFDMLEALNRAGLLEVVHGYLGERAVMSAQKCTLRKVEPDLPGAWHQDGKFLGEVRALNVWLSLSRCGDEAPGLDIVPRRIDHLLASGAEAGTVLWIHIPQELAEEAAGDVGFFGPSAFPGDYAPLAV